MLVKLQWKGAATQTAHPFRGMMKQAALRSGRRVFRASESTANSLNVCQWGSYKETVLRPSGRKLCVRELGSKGVRDLWDNWYAERGGWSCLERQKMHRDAHRSLGVLGQALGRRTCGCGQRSWPGPHVPVLPEEHMWFSYSVKTFETLNNPKEKVTEMSSCREVRQ